MFGLTTILRRRWVMVDDDDLNLVDIDVLDATSGDEEEVRGGQPRASAP